MEQYLREIVKIQENKDWNIAQRTKTALTHPVKIQENKDWNTKGLLIIMSVAASLKSKKTRIEII